MLGAVPLRMERFVAGQLRLAAVVHLAYLSEAEAAVPAFHIGGVLLQMGGAHIFKAVRSSAALAALNSGVVSQALNAIFLTIGFEMTDVQFVRFAVTAHVCPFMVGLSLRSWGGCHYFRHTGKSTVNWVPSSTLLFT